VRVIHILRKPLSTSTIAQSLVRHGTGAININACRLRADAPEGRWPPDLILEHLPGCELVGTKIVPVAVDPSQSFRDEGMEEVDDWECVDGCPVKALGRPSKFYLHVGGRR